MWACAKGHHETAITLFRFNHNALKVKNKKDRNPIEVAKDSGHDELAAELDHQEAKRKANDPPQLYSSTFLHHLQTMSNNTSDAATGTTDFTEFNTSIYDVSPSKLLASATDETDKSAGDESVADSVAELLSNSRANEDIDNSSPKSVESQSSNRSHDGVFLRPGAVSTR